MRARGAAFAAKEPRVLTKLKIKTMRVGPKMSGYGCATSSVGYGPRFSRRFHKRFYFQTCAGILSEV